MSQQLNSSFEKTILEFLLFFISTKNWISIFRFRITGIGEFTYFSKAFQIKNNKINSFENNTKNYATKIKSGYAKNEVCIDRVYRY